MIRKNRVPASVIPDDDQSKKQTLFRIDSAPKPFLDVLQHGFLSLAFLGRPGKPQIAVYGIRCVQTLAYATVRQCRPNSRQPRD